MAPRETPGAEDTIAEICIQIAATTFNKYQGGGDRRQEKTQKRGHEAERRLLRLQWWQLDGGLFFMTNKGFFKQGAAAACRARLVVRPRPLGLAMD